MIATIKTVSIAPRRPQHARIRIGVLIIDDDDDDGDDDDDDSPSSISCLVSSWLALVVRSTMLVKPMPSPINSRSLSAFIGRGIKPERNRHFPGKSTV